MRVPIVRADRDGTITDGTADATLVDGKVLLSDFRDLDGRELTLPPGSRFVIPTKEGRL